MAGGEGTREVSLGLAWRKKDTMFSDECIDGTIVAFVTENVDQGRPTQ